MRFDARAREFNAIGFAVLTVLMSGINVYAMALIFKVFLDWPITLGMWISAATVMGYIFLGALGSAIYNEVPQFFLIVFGVAPLALIGLQEVGGWQGLSARLPLEYVHAYAIFASPQNNPMGVPWYAVVTGFKIFVGTFYWCTDFLIAQRALAARNMAAASQTPLIGAFFNMLLPAIIVIPGLVAMIVIPEQVGNQYSMVVPS